MPCDIVVIPDIPVSASIPANTDFVIFTLADGTSVIRAWSVILNAITPNSEEYEVAVSGGDINNGNVSKTFTNFIGKRLKFFRNGIRQTTIIQAGANYYSFNSGTGEVTWFPAATTEEILTFDPY